MTVAAEGIEQPEPSALEAVERCLQRIRESNGYLHAVSRLFAETARNRAGELDASTAPKARNHGITFLAKEVFDIEGYETMFGSQVYARTPAATSSLAIKRLEQDGAILLGTTHMVEFAIGSWGTNHSRGTPRNPSDDKIMRVPGGSSSGSAVAVAAGMSRIALGSDTGGSIRIPAAVCGVIGYKPSYGLIPTAGVAPLAPYFDTVGPITRTISDARHAVEAMSGVDLIHPLSSLKGLRVAIVAQTDLDPISQEVLSAYQAVLVTVKEAGATVSTISLPDTFEGLQKLYGDIVAFEAYEGLASIVEDHTKAVDPFVRSRVLAGRSVTPQRYREAKDRLVLHRDTFGEFAKEFDVMLVPTTPIAAIPVEDVDENQAPLARYVRLINCLDLCAVTVPCQVGQGGLPVGIQVCGRNGADALVLAAAEMLVRLMSRA